MIVNTSTSTIQALRQLDEVWEASAQSSERLTSGKMINHAKDNAANLTMITRMDAQTIGGNQAIANLNDGVSLTQTIDGAVGGVSNLFQRMRELGLQSLNGVYSDENRQQMDAEFQALYQEAQRMTQSTQFNEKSLLTTDGTIQIQSSWQLGNENKTGVKTMDLLATIGDITVTVPGIPPTPGTDDTLKFEAPTGFNSSLLGLYADSYTLNLMGQSLAVKNSGLLPLSGADIYASSGANANQQVASFINSDPTLQAAGYSATYNGGDGSFTVASSSGNMGAGDISWVVNSDAGAPLSFSSSVIPGTPPDPGTPESSYVISGATIDHIRTVTDASVAVESIDRYLTRFKDYRAEIGATQNRLEFSVSRVENERQQVMSSRSRIQDADYARESANLTRSKVMQNATSAILAHSKEIPKTVISTLLR